MMVSSFWPAISLNRALVPAHRVRRVLSAMVDGIRRGGAVLGGVSWSKLSQKFRDVCGSEKPVSTLKLTVEARKNAKRIRKTYRNRAHVECKCYSLLNFPPQFTAGTRAH